MSPMDYSVLSKAWKLPNTEQSSFVSTATLSSLWIQNRSFSSHGYMKQKPPKSTSIFRIQMKWNIPFYQQKKKTCTSLTNLTAVFDAWIRALAILSEEKKGTLERSADTLSLDGLGGLTEDWGAVHGPPTFNLKKHSLDNFHELPTFKKSEAVGINQFGDWNFVTIKCHHSAPSCPTRLLLSSDGPSFENLPDNFKFQAKIHWAKQPDFQADWAPVPKPKCLIGAK